MANPPELRVQPWLIPYVNPLLKRFGNEYFKSIPKKPGVYLMRGIHDSLLYVGKAKDLRARLNSYKRARPDQVSRKVIRMLNLLVRIEWQECESEEAALLRENALLREHKPPFNVVNTRHESYYFIGLKIHGTEEDRVAFKLTTKADPGKHELFGTYKGRGRVRDGYAALLRLIWLSHQAEPAESGNRFEYPGRLTRRQPPYDYEIRLSASISAEERARWRTMIRRFLNGTSRTLLDHLMERLLAATGIPPFFYHYIQEDLEALGHFFDSGPHRNKRLRKAHGLSTRLIAQDQIDDLLVTYRTRKA